MGKRVKLHFDSKFQSISYKRCWIYLPKEYKYISDLRHEICERYLQNKQEKQLFYLTLENYYLLPNENIHILKENDIIEVKLFSEEKKKRIRKTKKRKIENENDIEDVNQIENTKENNNKDDNSKLLIALEPKSRENRENRESQNLVIHPQTPLQENKNLRIEKNSKEKSSPIIFVNNQTQSHQKSQNNNNNRNESHIRFDKEEVNNDEVDDDDDDNDNDEEEEIGSKQISEKNSSSHSLQLSTSNSKKQNHSNKYIFQSTSNYLNRLQPEITPTSKNTSSSSTTTTPTTTVPVNYPYTAIPHLSSDSSRKPNKNEAPNIYSFNSTVTPRQQLTTSSTNLNPKRKVDNTPSWIVAAMNPSTPSNINNNNTITIQKSWRPPPPPSSSSSSSSLPLPTLGAIPVTVTVTPTFLSTTTSTPSTPSSYLSTSIKNSTKNIHQKNDTINYETKEQITNKNQIDTNYENENNDENDDENGEEGDVVNMGQEKVKFFRPKRKFELIVSTDKSLKKQNKSDLNNSNEVLSQNNSSTKYLRIPVSHRHNFKKGDHIAYKTIKLCEVTWNPIVSDIFEGTVIEITQDESDEILYTIQIESNDELDYLTWKDISEAWMLIDKDTVPKPNDSKNKLSQEFEELLKQKKSMLMS